MKYLDNLLNSITMYRLVLYILISLSLVSCFLHPEYFFSLILTLSLCHLINLICSRLTKVTTNHESSIITSLIIFLTVDPFNNLQSFIVLAVACSASIACKYLLLKDNRHIFNPAAFGLAVASFLPYGGVSWWVGNRDLVWFVIPAVFLIARKLRKFSLVLSFIVFSYLLSSDKSLSFLTSGPYLFLAGIMLTEPLTLPGTFNFQLAYAALIGLATGFLPPERALALVNLIFFFINYRPKLNMKLLEVKEIGQHIYEFVFEPNTKVDYAPGQYMEWTLPTLKIDSRGNRRYFTLASSPTEKLVRLGIKFPAKPSQFKNSLNHLRLGDSIVAGPIMGDFVLPQDPKTPLLFIAGGIGITPFRSMVKYLQDTNQKRDIVLIYACANKSEFVYRDILDSIRTHYHVGRLQLADLLTYSPDYKQRRVFVSGPGGMVDSLKSELIKSDVSPFKIVTDYFPGF